MFLITIILGFLIIDNDEYKQLNDICDNETSFNVIDQKDTKEDKPVNYIERDTEITNRKKLVISTCSILNKPIVIFNTVSAFNACFMFTWLEPILTDFLVNILGADEYMAGIYFSLPFIPVAI